MSRPPHSAARSPLLCPRLRRGYRLALQRDAEPRLRVFRRERQVAELSWPEALMEVPEAVTAGSTSLGELRRTVRDRTALDGALQRLEHTGTVAWRLSDRAGATLANIEPTRLDAELRLAPLVPHAEHQWCSRARLRAAGRTWILSSPLAPITVEVPRLEALHHPRLRRLLAGTGLLEGTYDSNPAHLALWEEPDLAFHCARRGFGRRHGARWRTGPPPPPRRCDDSEGCVPLPDAPPITRAPTLADALAQRASRRNPDPQRALDRKRLGTLLALSTRTRARHESRIPARGGGPERRFETLRRPYPSPGGLHALEFHVMVRRSADLAPGLYRYDAQAHALNPESAWGQRAAQAQETIIRHAQQATGAAEPPDAVVLVTADLARIAWKYTGIVYSLLLLEAGAWLEAAALCAGPSGIALCAQGAGESDTLAIATGSDPLREPVLLEVTLNAARHPTAR